MPTWQEVSTAAAEVSTAAADLANAQEQLRTYGQIASLYEREVELLRRKAQRAAQDADSAEVLVTQKRERADEDSGALASKKADLGRLQATIQDTEAVIAEAYRAIEESNIKRMFESDDVSAEPPPPPPPPVRVGPCKTCGTAVSSRFRKAGTICNACYLKKERGSDDDFNRTLDLDQ
ncbi:unnamed protein product [Tilletia controversa]|nr:unnamed protein product [Tilletia controversa]